LSPISKLQIFFITFFDIQSKDNASFKLVKIILMISTYLFALIITSCTTSPYR